MKRSWTQSILPALAVMLVASSLLEAKKPTIPAVTFTHNDAERSYFVHAPDSLDEHSPLLLLLHGSGRDGMSLIDKWRALADEEGILLVAPNSAESSQWSPYADNPEFLRAVIDDVKQHHTFNSAGVVLFGHSGGAVWGLQIGLLAAEDYRGVAVHAGLIPPESHSLMGYPKTKIPFHIQVGTRDPYFPVVMVRDTAEKLEAAGFEITLVEIARHDHDYYRKAKKINATAWEFLKALATDSEAVSTTTAE